MRVDSGSEPTIEEPSIVAEPPPAYRGPAAESAVVDGGQDTEPDPPPDPPAAPDPPATPPWGLALGPLAFRPSAEVWLRGEVRVDTPGTGGREQFFVASRIRLGLEVRWDWVRLFVQAQDARVFGQVPPGQTDGSPTTFQQGWVQLGHDDLFLRAGRQEYALGGERMIGPLLWTAPARTFDALRVHGQWGQVQADAIGALTGAPGSFVDPISGALVESWGDYLGVARVAWAPGAELSLEPYVLYRHDGPTEALPSRERNIANFGVRGTGTLADVISYELEGMLQTGEVAGQEHLAFGLIADVTARVGTEAGLSLTGGVSYGSGASPDGSVDELDNFFPTNHLFYGYADYFGLRNLVEGWARVLLASPSVPQFRVWLDAHLFGFPEPMARWTNAGGAQIGSAATNPDGFAGGEVDLELRWTPVDTFFVWAGYALFIPASGASVRGVDGPSHWAYLMLGSRLP